VYNVEISGELVHHVDGLLQGEAVQQLIALASTLGDGVYAPGDVELLDVKELLHRCGARSFSSVSSCTQRLNTETVRQQLTQYPRSEFRLPSWNTDLPKGTINWLEELNARGELIHFKGVDANVLEGLKAVGELTHSLKGVFLEAESTVLVCAFEMHWLNGKPLQ
jgi:hypothetical protein